MSMILAIGGCLHPIHVVQPSITLASSLTSPASWTVGTPVSFTVTATPANGATGPVTISATGLPAGVTLGSTTDNGNGTYTASGSGTPTTAQAAADVTFSTSGGSVAATPLVVSVAVQAASTGGVTLVGIVTAPDQTGAGTQATTSDPITVAAGDQIYVTHCVGGKTFATSGMLAPTDSQGNTYTLDVLPSGMSYGNAAVWHATASAAGALTVTCKNSAGYVHQLAAVYVLRGAAVAVDTANVVANTGVPASYSPFTFGPLTAHAEMPVLIGCIVSSGNQPYSAVSGGIVIDALNATTKAFAAHVMPDADGGITSTASANGGQTVYSYIAVPLKAAA